MVKNWIRERRDKLQISQETLAARLQEQGFDITAGTISHWERGRYQPPMDTSEFRQALAKALRISIPAMLAAAGYEIAAQYGEDAMYAADIIEHLSEEKKKLALGILEQIRQGA
jgi:transcriptional regulator with XRE-family HTH domain